MKREGKLTVIIGKDGKVGYVGGVTWILETGKRVGDGNPAFTRKQQAMMGKE